MNWQTNTPTETGFYWLSEKVDDAFQRPLVVLIFRVGDMGSLYVGFAVSGAVEIEYFTGKGDKWAGPILPPEPPISIVHKDGAGGFLNLDNDYGINEVQT